MEAYHPIHTALCLEGLCCNPMYFWGVSNSEDYFYSFIFQSLQGGQCPYRSKLLNLEKVTDFMKFITYPINLNNEPTYKVHNKAFLV